MATDAQRQAAYNAELERQRRRLLGLDRKARVATIREFVELHRQVLTILAGEIASGTASVQLWQESRIQIEQAVAAFTARYEVTALELAAEGWTIGTDLAFEPIEQASIALTVGRGISSELFDLATLTLPEMITNTGTEAQQRIAREIIGIATGSQTSEAALRNIGSNLSESLVFRSIRARSEAILTTEVGRIQSIATHASYERLQADVAGLRKRWVNAHLPGARETHLAAEARYAVGGTTGPIPMDQLFSVGGERGLYPRAGSFSARNVVWCRCQSLAVLPEVLPAEPGVGVFGI